MKADGKPKESESTTSTAIAAVWTRQRRPLVNIAHDQEFDGITAVRCRGNALCTTQLDAKRCQLSCKFIWTLGSLSRPLIPISI